MICYHWVVSFKTCRTRVIAHDRPVLLEITYYCKMFLQNYSSKNSFYRIPKLLIKLIFAQW